MAANPRPPRRALRPAPDEHLRLMTKVARLYHANSPIVVKRTVYLIGPDGTIRFAQRGMPSPKQVLAAAPAAL